MHAGGKESYRPVGQEDDGQGQENNWLHRHTKGVWLSNGDGVIHLLHIHGIELGW